MIEIIDKQSCCGCEACVQVCPKHYISFEEDLEGFRYPLVNREACIDCGLCEKICPVLKQEEKKEPQDCYAAKNNSEEELLASSSGGLFILLAKAVLKDGGVVFGARFDKDWNVIHAYAETYEDAKAFMGSKYVQSRIGNSYIVAKEFLQAGRKVLFTGTPCQIAGLKNFLRKDYENLLTVDVICHGVPSPKVWQMYLDEIRRNASNGEDIVSFPLNPSLTEGNVPSDKYQIRSISFRDKRLGWKKFSFVLTLAKASTVGKQNSVSFSHMFLEDPYMKVFLKNINLRPSCYSCPAKGGKSRSDITIADFWGVEKVLPDFDDNRGVGLIMVNTDKGKDIAECLDIVCQKVSYQEAVMSNPFYFRSVNLHANRAKFFHLIDKNDSIIQLSERMLRPSMKIRVKRFLSKLKRKIL